MPSTQAIADSNSTVGGGPVRSQPSLRGLPPTLGWVGGIDGALHLLDQTLLPAAIETRICRTVDEVVAAIRALAVRGAPAIGVAGAYGVCVGLNEARPASAAAAIDALTDICRRLIESRPTAVNLAWAVNRVHAAAERALRQNPSLSAGGLAERLLAECHAIRDEEAEACRRIGQAGAHLIRDGMGVLTHCNAGALATIEYGTALAPLYVAHEQGRRFRVYADETRPLLQGARLTALELAAAGIEVRIACDGAAASLMQAGRVQLVIVGADRIAANGDTANKIGTLSVALAAKHFGVPFYVAAPRSTFDPSLARGEAIPIEQRSELEVSQIGGRIVAAQGVKCENPAFDVTPAGLISGILTPNGCLEPVSEQIISRFLLDGSCKGGLEA